MALFGINIQKLPHGKELDVLQNEVWFPRLENASEQTRILNQPGIKKRLDKVRDEQDAEAAVFEVNKAIKGPFAKVGAGRPGIIARTSDTSFEVHLPVQTYPFDIGSIAMQTVEFTPDTVELHEQTGDLGRLALARAIRAQVSAP